ncbi:hypothetical protein AVEN_221432-1 [Araneus ventricosus]|uniref:Reverse transcriptase domain-containing protein n=1 Tax=Araneus ventricosus TaxID=182803 RepID=A0A4Y2MPV5_ARAVE|nr:hypothetical protein AVEN_221432-1 [Araneus ventricosus]
MTVCGQFVSNILEVLIKFKLREIATSTHIRQHFLPICFADKRRIVIRFLLAHNDPHVEKKPILEVYRFNRVIFAVNACPFLPAATVKHHIEMYLEDYLTAVQHLVSFMYVDEWITGEYIREEALLVPCRAKNIMKEAELIMPKWISNDS